MSNSIFDWLNLIAQNVWLYGGAFLLVLGVLVFVHEWGHYIVARLCGVKIESFSVGFGKELFGITDKRGTRWKFSLVPLGGYVKMFGDVDPASARHTEEVKDVDSNETRPLTEEEKGVAFFSQPVARRAAIVFAGPAINFLFAILIMALLFMFYGQPVTPPVATGVMVGSAADKAGFQPHDIILDINGKAINRFEDVKREVMVGLDTPMDITIERAGQKQTIQVTPVKSEARDHFGFKHSRGLLGVIGPGNAIDIAQIAAVDGQDTLDNPEKAQKLLAARLGRDITIQFKGVGDEQGDRLVTRPLSEANKDFSNTNSENYSLLYIAETQEQNLVKHNAAGAIAEAARETANIAVSTLQSLGQMIVGVRSAQELGGIIRIGAMAGDMAKSGFITLVTFTALLSINLGLINLFPIPMLDGGHLVFYAVESVKGSPIPEQIQEYAFRLGLAILVGIMLFANLNDVLQLFLKG